MSINTWAVNDPRALRISVYYEGEDTIREGMPLCYNYLGTKNWSGVDKADGTESTTTTEGSQNEGKWIRVGSPVTVNSEEGIPVSGSTTITLPVGDGEDWNNIKVGQFVTITGTHVTNGTYEVTAVGQGEEDVTGGTLTLDMTAATGATEDVTVVVDNSLWFAGAVASGGWVGQTGPTTVDVYVPNGAMVPVRTDKDCTIGDSLGLGSSVFEAATGDDDPAAVALCVETVNRSSTNGLVLAKLFSTGQQILGGQAYFKPVRGAASGYVYGFQIEGTKVLRGTAASKSYVMQISADRESGYVATGDSNDALLKIQGSNYAACDTNYILRGINVSINARSGGTMGILTNNVSISIKGGATVATGIALQVDAQDLAATAKTEFGGLDVAINREGVAATTEYGIQIRTRGTINTKMDSVFRIEKGTDLGFTNLFAVDAAATITMTSSDGGVSTHKIPIDDNGTTRYIMVSDG